MKPGQARVGLRVKDEFLGEGVIDDLLTGRVSRHVAGAMVRFDETPPFDYNCGHNPCLRFFETLEPTAEPAAAPGEGER